MHLVFYHGKCTDGACAAWSALRYFEDSDVAALYYPLLHEAGGNFKTFSSDIERFDGTDTIYFLDICPSFDTLVALSQVARKVIVLDHHKSALDGLEGKVLPKNVHVTLDMEKSGAMLSFEHFFGGDPVPDVVRYVQDRDLWKHVLPNTKEISAFIQSKSPTPQCFDEISRMTTLSMVECGRVLIDARNNRIAEMSTQARRGRLPGFATGTAVTVNVGFFDASDTLNHLLSSIGGDVAIGYCRLADGNWKYSCRSNDASQISAKEFSEYWGGGGHDHAAGFVLSDLLF